MKSPFCFSAGALCLLLSASSATAAVNVIHSWSMGDTDGGVAGAAAGASLTDSVGGINIALTGAPTYAALGGSVGVDFENAGSAHNVAATQYYSNILGDVNPADNARWGFEAIVRIDLLPATNQEMAVFELGGGQNGLLLQTFGNGAWTIHQSNVAIKTAPAAVKVGQTQHLAAVRNGGDWELWVDGTLATSFGFASADYNPAAGIRIGAGNAGTGNNRGFNGVIDTVRVFDYTGSFNINDTLYGVPEPSSAGLLALGGLLALRRRR